METIFLKQTFYILETYITLPSSYCGEITTIVLLRAVTHPVFHWSSEDSFG